MSEQPALILFAKAPIRGFVKRRLCPPLSRQQAVELYAHMLETILTRAGGLGCSPSVLAVSPDDRVADFRSARSEFSLVVGQGQGDLGERLSRIVAEVSRQCGKPMLIIGADAPDLPDRVFKQAADIVGKGRYVMCPSHDGGYCLLGMPRSCPALFSGIAWGSSLVAAQTREAALRAGIDLAELETWRDVDTIADVLDLIERLSGARDPHLIQLRRRLICMKLPTASREESS